MPYENRRLSKRKSIVQAYPSAAVAVISAYTELVQNVVIVNEVTKARITLVKSDSRKRWHRCRPEETILEYDLPAGKEVSLFGGPLANGKYISSVKGTGKFLLSSVFP